MENKKSYQGPILAFIIFLIVGSVFVGTTSEVKPPEVLIIHEDCQEYTKDEDGDMLNGFIDDLDCQDYPYEDGSGETSSINLPPTTSLNPPYQTYHDLTVDFVRFFINNECGGNLNGCIGTNFDNEGSFYCWFSDNVMSNDFFSIYDRAFNQIQSIPDDGSLNVFTNTCLMFPPSNNPSELPNMGTQTSSPIAENPSGDSNGGQGGMK